MLKVEYERTFDDYADFALHRSRGLSSIRGAILQQRCWMVFIFATIATAFFLIGPSDLAVFVGVALAAGGIVTWGLIPKTIWKKVAVAVRSNGAELGVETTTIELTLTENTLVMEDDAMRVEVRWDRMKGVEVVGDCTYIHMVAGMAAVVVRDGFEEDRDYFAVQKFALRKLGGELPQDDD